MDLIGKVSTLDGPAIRVQVMNGINKANFPDTWEAETDFLVRKKITDNIWGNTTQESRWWQLTQLFIFTPDLGEDFQFHSYFSDGLKPPTRNIYAEFPKNQRLDPPKKRGLDLVFCRVLGSPSFEIS